MSTHPRTLTYEELTRGVPTVSGPQHARSKLGHPLPARECRCIYAPIPLEDGRDLKCGRHLADARS